MKGVPKGSILGPVLFTVYINNIGLSATMFYIHLYADDNVVNAIAPTVDQAPSVIQSACIA